MSQPQHEGPLMVYGTAQRSRDQHTRVALCTFSGTTYFDIRAGIVESGKPFVPTKKGITISPRQLPWLIDTLTAALADARARNLFQPEGTDT